MAWTILEGLRVLLEEWGIALYTAEIRVDNQAAITILNDSANWRTRYFGVRGARVHEEVVKNRLAIVHEGTKDMVADAMTKLGTKEMLDNVRLAMQGVYPVPLKALPAPCHGES